MPTADRPRDARVAVRVPGDDAEEHDERLREGIRGVDGRVERGIVDRALRSLHPVHDRLAAGIDPVTVSPRRARILAETRGKRAVDHDRESLTGTTGLDNAQRRTHA